MWVDDKKLSGAKESLPENLCGECPTLGLCCYHGVVDEKKEKKVILPNLPCRFLDTNTKLCTVYEDRFEKNPNCRSMTDLAIDDGCPPECEYKEHIDFKVTDVRVADLGLENQIFMELVAKAVEKEEIPATWPDEFQAEVKRLIESNDNGKG